MTATSPSPATGPVVWRTADIGPETIHALTPTQAQQILDLARGFEAGEAEFPSIPFRHSLASLAPLMARVRHELLQGRGIALLRGVPVDAMSERQCALAFWGIGSFLGQGVSQSSSGDLIGFVRDRGDGKRENRGYQSRAALRFHVDLADLVGLLCVRRGMSGGESLAASSLTIYNEMLELHPEYLDALAAGFHWSRNGEEGPGEAAYSAVVPVFTQAGGMVSCRFNASMMQRGMASAGQQLTRLQEEALDFVEATARRRDICHATYMEPGDIQFLNNYTTLHCRTEFENWPDPARDRLMLRLWLLSDGVRDFGGLETAMRDAPLIYGRQGRTPEQLATL